MSNTTRNDVKQLAERIEVLAKEIQEKLTNDGDFLWAANELARNNVTFVFTLGEFYALNKQGSTGTVKATPIKSGAPLQNYHNLRDSRGRFTRKV